MYNRLLNLDVATFNLEIAKKINESTDQKQKKRALNTRNYFFKKEIPLRNALYKLNYNVLGTSSPNVLKELEQVVASFNPLKPLK